MERHRCQENKVTGQYALIRYGRRQDMVKIIKKIIKIIIDMFLSLNQWFRLTQPKTSENVPRSAFPSPKFDFPDFFLYPQDGNGFSYKFLDSIILQKYANYMQMS